MINRTAAALLAASFLGLQCVPAPAHAENQMGYRFLSAREASGLPRRGGALGMDIGPAQQVSDSGMTFEVLRVNGVRRGSPGAQAGFNQGDLIIAADGLVFPGVAAFAAYAGSVQPGRQMAVDYIPAGGGPQNAQRVGITVGSGGGRAAPVQQDDQARSSGMSPGMSTGTKLAIGAGAAALFGCYELGCFSRTRTGSGSGRQQPAYSGYQQR